MAPLRMLREHLPPRLLPPDLYRKAFIAGGYAADQDLAQDIDVWVRCSDLDTVQSRLLEHLKGLGSEYAFEVQNMTEEQVADGHGYDQVPVFIRKVALVTFAGFKPVHLMVTDAPMAAVLEGFDISTHQIALDYYGMECPGAEWTPVTALPVARLANSRTPARMEKIMARYAHLRTAPQEVPVGE